MVVVSIIAGAWFVYPVLKLQHQQQQEVESIEAELAAVKERNSDLQQEIKDLSTPEGVEQAARESLGYIKEGEQAYVVTTEESTLATSSETSETAAASDSLWQQLLNLFFGSQ